MGRGLSEKQRQIIAVFESEESAGYVTNRSVLLRRVYGLESIWKPEYEETRLRGRRYEHNYKSSWNPNYKAAGAALSRSLTRLAARGIIKYTYAPAPGNGVNQWGWRLTAGLDPEVEATAETERRESLARLDRTLASISEPNG